MPKSAPRPRRRGHDQVLSVEAIVETALQLAHDSHVDAVTLRQVAAELHTGQSSLYVWVPNRVALLQLMLSRALEDIRLPRPDPATWQRQLVTLVTKVGAALDRYPGLAKVMLGEIPVDPASLRLADCYLALMRAGSVPDRAAAYAVDTLNLYVASASLEKSMSAVVLGDPAGPPLALDRNDYAATRSLFGSIDADRFPHLHRLSAEMSSGSARARFAFGLETFVAGLAAQTSR